MSRKKLSGNAIFTICSANYLPQAIVTLESIRKNSSSADVFLLMCERSKLRPFIEIPEHVNLIFADELEIEDFGRMSFYYNVIELNTAIKPFFINRLFSNGYSKVLYFDPDIFVYQDIEENFFDELNTNDVLLTPHNLAPFADDGCYPRLEDVVRAGQYNLGFLGVRASDEMKGSVEWWADRLKEKCLFDPEHKYFTDQFWAALFSSFAACPKIIRSKGYNVAYWNIFQREITESNGVVSAGRDTLVFFHFSGFDSEDATVLSKHTTRTIEYTDALKNLMELYSGFVKNAKRTYLAEPIPYSFGTYFDGSEILDSDRRKFLDKDDISRMLEGDPFVKEETDPAARVLNEIKHASEFLKVIYEKYRTFGNGVSSQTIVSQLMKEQEDFYGLPLYMEAVYSFRPDLRSHIPRSAEDFSSRLNDWFEHSGNHEYNLKGFLEFTKCTEV